MSEVKPASATKPADGLGADAEVNIEDFRGDSATDDIARQAVLKSIVDTEQKGAMLHMLCCTSTRRLICRIAKHAVSVHTQVFFRASYC